MAQRTVTVTVLGRIPLSTKARVRMAATCCRLGAVRLAYKTVSRLAYDVKVGNGRWQRHHLISEVHEGDAKDAK